jgi:hypothetical protein
MAVTRWAVGAVLLALCFPSFACAADYWWVANSKQSFAFVDASRLKQGVSAV